MRDSIIKSNALGWFGNVEDEVDVITKGNTLGKNKGVFDGFPDSSTSGEMVGGTDGDTLEVNIGLSVGDIFLIIR